MAQLFADFERGHSTFCRLRWGSLNFLLQSEKMDDPPGSVIYGRSLTITPKLLHNLQKGVEKWLEIGFSEYYGQQQYYVV